MIQMFEIHYTNKFKKDYKTITRRDYQLELLKDVIRRLAKNGTLPKKFLSHPLSGKYKDAWECHIKPDWLLIWSVDYQTDEIWLVRTGTHSDLF
jgi:mRNA interferase YafQ